MPLFPGGVAYHVKPSPKEEALLREKNNLKKRHETISKLGLALLLFGFLSQFLSLFFK